MLTIGKSEFKFEEIPNKFNRKIRINILNALERRYTFTNVAYEGKASWERSTRSLRGICLALLMRKSSGI